MDITRRAFVGGLVATGAGLLVPTRAAAPPPSPANAADDADFTFVHLTDMHVTPRRRGDAGYRACVESVRALRPRPAFALMGGDLAFDGNYTAKADFETQIRLYRELSDGLEIGRAHV